MHGFESVVGPVKGVFDKETSLNKAREHSLLRSDRPAYVTILSLGMITFFPLVSCTHILRNLGRGEFCPLEIYQKSMFLPQSLHSNYFHSGIIHGPASIGICFLQTMILLKMRFLTFFRVMNLFSILVKPVDSFSELCF